MTNRLTIQYDLSRETFNVVLHRNVLNHLFIPTQLGTNPAPRFPITKSINHSNLAFFLGTCEALSIKQGVKPNKRRMAIAVAKKNKSL